MWILTSQKKLLIRDMLLFEFIASENIGNRRVYIRKNNYALVKEKMWHTLAKYISHTTKNIYITRNNTHTDLGLKHGRYFHPPIRSSAVSFFRSSIVPFVIPPIKIATIKGDSKIVLSPTSLTVASVLSLLRARSSIVRNYYSQRQ